MARRVSLSQNRSTWTPEAASSSIQGNSSSSYKASSSLKRCCSSWLSHHTQVVCPIELRIHIYSPQPQQTFSSASWAALLCGGFAILRHPTTAQTYFRPKGGDQTDRKPPEPQLYDVPIWQRWDKSSYKIRYDGKLMRPWFDFAKSNFDRRDDKCPQGLIAFAVCE